MIFNVNRPDWFRSRGLLISSAICILFGSMPNVSADEAAAELSKAATDPTALLMSFNFIGDQPVRWAITPQYNLKNDDDLVKWKLVFTFTLLVPTG